MLINFPNKEEVPANGSIEVKFGNVRFPANTQEISGIYVSFGDAEGNPTVEYSELSMATTLPGKPTHAAVIIDGTKNGVN